MVQLMFYLIYMGLQGSARGSFRPTLDYGVRRPRNATINADVAAVLVEDEGAIDNGLEEILDGGEPTHEHVEDQSDDERAVHAPLQVDYMLLLEPYYTDPHELGVVRAILQVIDDRWEAGNSTTVGGISCYLRDIDAQGLPRMTVMMLEVLRRASTMYRSFGTVGDLSPYWCEWLQRAETRIYEDSALRTQGARDVDGPVDSEDASLMQTSGRRLTLAERMTRPRRPAEWVEARAVIDRLPRLVAERVRALLRSFLTNLVNGMGFIYVELAMMLRDVLHDSALEPPPGRHEATAQATASHIQAAIRAYIDRNRQADHRTSQPMLLHAALRLAMGVDEMDPSLLEAGAGGEGDIEEVHLMFRVNNAVREVLPREGSERCRRLSLIMRAVSNQIGSDARHLRRLCMGLHGLQMFGNDRCSALEVEGNDTWLAPLLDELHLMASSETLGISVEGEWTQELMTLRRWLAEDHLDPTRPDMDPDAKSSHEASAAEEHSAVEAEGDDMHLMQRGRRPWWQRQRSRSRSPRRRTRRERNERMREVERTNEHRPWRTGEAQPEGQRTSSFMSARPSCSGPTAASTPREGRTRHPAQVSTPQGERNMGIHVWHILADMASAHDDPPENLTYGLRPTQRLNVEATLDSMSDGERVHMLISFVRMVALLLNDVAAIAEQVVGANDIEEAEGAGAAEEEDDEAGLMEKFLIKPSAKDAESKAGVTSPRQLDEIFASQFELQLRTLISALELGSGTTMMQRAKALLERLRLRYGHSGSETIQYHIELMTSALVTFLPQDEEISEYRDTFEKLGLQDRDFVEYWWHLLDPHLRGDGNPGTASSSAAPVPSPVVPVPAPAELTEEELSLIRQYEEEDRMARTKLDREEFEKRAQEECQQVIDSQEADSQRMGESLAQSLEASRFRDWD